MKILMNYGNRLNAQVQCEMHRIFVAHRRLGGVMQKSPKQSESSSMQSNKFEDNVIWSSSPLVRSPLQLCAHVFSNYKCPTARSFLRFVSLVFLFFSLARLVRHAEFLRNNRAASGMNSAHSPRSFRLLFCFTVHCLARKFNDVCGIFISRIWTSLRQPTEFSSMLMIQFKNVVNFHSAGDNENRRMRSVVYRSQPVDSHTYDCVAIKSKRTFFSFALISTF